MIKQRSNTLRIYGIIYIGPYRVTFLRLIFLNKFSRRRRNLFHFITDISCLHKRQFKFRHLKILLAQVRHNFIERCISQYDPNFTDHFTEEFVAVAIFKRKACILYILKAFHFGIYLRFAALRIWKKNVIQYYFDAFSPNEIYIFFSSHHIMSNITRLTFMKRLICFVIVNFSIASCVTRIVKWPHSARSFLVCK